MPQSELTEAAEEILSDLWLAREKNGEASLELGGDAPEAEEPVRELAAAGLVEERSGRVSLTGAGELEAAGIVRRERLAERLLVDVLNLGPAVAAEAACRFEHVLRKGIDDEICTLLGHPRVCPHGSPIPPGDCCRAGAREAGKVISSLADLSPGQRGVIAYLHGRRREVIQRMLALGAVPGTPVVLLQRYPSYVFQMGYGQVAVDQETAREIYVRLAGRPPAPGPRGWWLTRPLRRLRFRRGRRRP